MKTNYRNTVAEINLKNLYKNYLEVQKRVGEDKVIIPVVKANAYGHGAVPVVGYLVKKGVDHFAVSLLEEALQLKESFPKISILCMTLVEDEGLLIASEYGISVTISNFDQIETLRNLTKPLTVHLKVDTGMHRLGFRSDQDILRAFELLQKNSFVCLEGLFTHFSTADDNLTYYRIQLERFMEIRKLLNFNFKMVHISNSSSQIKFERSYDFTTHTRLGISLYGLTLDKETRFLHNTFRLKTKIGQLNFLHAGDKLGYGASYTANSDEIIAVLPIGYADGFFRKNSGGFVEINSKRYEIVGRICMGMTFVRVDESVKKNDEVILFGGLVSIDDVANRLDTINYEVICGISSRVPRVYIK
jgi:alanine racemase